MDCSLYLSALGEVEYCVGIWSVSAKKKSVPMSKRGIVLDDDQGVGGLFKNSHELKDCEGSANLQDLEAAVKLAEDCGVVPADVEDL